jgi:hypothetical protein
MKIKWNRATYDDIQDIYTMAHQLFGTEVDTILKLSPNKFRYSLAQAILLQQYDPTQQLIATAHDDDKLVGYFWLARQYWTTYSDDEIAEFRFIHTDLSLPSRSRYRIVVAALEQAELWCLMNNIPVLCSTSIRGDYTTFMRLHRQRQYTVHGSYAWKRITTP